MRGGLLEHAYYWGRTATAPPAPPALTYDQYVLSLGPTAYWPMNEASGNLLDATGNGWHATMVGTHTYAQTGPTINGVASLAVNFGDTTSDYFWASASFPQATAAGVSWMTWIKVPAIAALAGILTRTATNQEAWRINLTTNGTPEFRNYTASNPGTVIADIDWSAQADDDAWHCLICLWNESTDTASIILDNGTPVTGSGTGPMATDANTAIQISSLSTGGANPYTGLGAKFAIFPRVLTAGEITSLTTGVF
jgi:hypothetical protein